MIQIRNFTPEDARLVDGRFGGRAGELIEQWGKRSFGGRYFEMLAVVDGGKIVGTVSLYEHSKSVVSLGVEIFEEYRGRGYGCGGSELALERAKGLGYSVVMDQVRADNVSSIGLHEKLGFENDGYVYINRKGDEVLIFVKPLG